VPIAPFTRLARNVPEIIHGRLLGRTGMASFGFITFSFIEIGRWSTLTTLPLSFTSRALLVKIWQ
jgi:hypothetical protein